MKRTLLKNRTQLKDYLQKHSVEYRPTYMHEDYITTSVSMPYDVKFKLDKLAKKFRLTRSGLICTLIEQL